MAEADVPLMRRRSVTEGEQKLTSVNFYLIPYLMQRPLTSIPPDPPPYWSYERDIVLRNTFYAESMWADAVGIAVTKMQSAGWSVKGTARKMAWAQGLLLNAEFGRGWRYFIGKLGQDFLCTDNGAFIEIIRATAGTGAKIVGIAHLDSLRCRRTGDDEIPVVYRDFVGAEHELKWHQVFSVVDMPDSSATMRGVGHCAASRAYATIYKMANIERYIAEKASGRRPTKLTFISNVSETQVIDAMQAAQNEADKKGLTTYLGAAVVPTQNDQVPATVEVKLMEIEERVVLTEERSDTYLRYANAIGLDSQELQPLHGRALGTGAQSQILDDKERGKFGWFDNLAEQINLRSIVGNATVFAFSQKDWRDQQLEATVKKTRADTRAVMVQSGEISAAESRQLAAATDDIPREMAQTDQNDVETVYDTDNPAAEQAAADEAGTEPSPAAPPAQPPAQPPKTNPRAAAVQTMAKQVLGIKERIEYKEHDGVMVALYLPPSLAYWLALCTARAVDPAFVTLPREMHLTLAFLGKAAEIANYQIPLQEALDEFARNEPWIAGTINGIGRFATSEDGNTNALYASFDCVELPEFRQRLMGAIRSTGVPFTPTHGFTPHITLAYIPAAAPMPDVRLSPEAFTVNRIVMAWGGEQTEYQLGAWAMKDRSTVDLATLSPKRATSLPEGSMAESLFLERVADEFDDYGRLQALAAREECPESGVSGESGKLRDSIRYAVEGKGSRDIQLRWFAGSPERPEVVVRSSLYGRRGFGAREKGKALRFIGKDGKEVFAEHVGPAAANDWWGRAWDRTAPQRSAMIARIGAMEKEFIDVAGVQRANAEHIDGYNPNGKSEQRAKVVNA